MERSEERINKFEQKENRLKKEADPQGPVRAAAKGLTCMSSESQRRGEKGRRVEMFFKKSWLKIP